MVIRFFNSSSPSSGLRSLSHMRKHRRTASVWSGELSFASPEADFNTSYLRDQVHDVHTDSSPSWSSAISFSSPFSDFVGQHSVHEAANAVKEANNEEWSGQYSFASPESDFTSDPQSPLRKWIEEQHWSEELSFASPESDFKAALVADRVNAREEEQRATEVALARVASHPLLHLPIDTPESALGSVPMHHLMEDHHVEQLEPLPSTVEEALVDERAIVITDSQAPFHIVDVNDSWVGLCEFSKAEAKNSSLRLIQGQDTDRDALRHVMASLLHGEEATAIVTNYTKSGRKFYNQLRAGPIRHPETAQVTHFVGILREVMEQPEVGLQRMSA